MRRVLRALRTAAGFVIGLFMGGAVILLATRTVVGDGVATAPVDSTFTANFIIVLGWFVGTALGCWVTYRVAKSHTSATIVCAWLFTTVWLSPGVRPALLVVRLGCAIAVGIAGFGTLLLARLRQSTEIPRQAKTM